MRLGRLLVALSLCAAGSAAPAEASPPFHGQNAARRAFELEAGGVTLIVDGSGRLAGVAAAATEPMPGLDADTLAAAQSVAARRARESLSRFMTREQSVEAAARDIEEALRASAALGNAAIGEIPGDARRALAENLAANLAANRQRFGTSGPRPELLVESGYQAEGKAAWARVSVGHRPRRPAWAGAERTRLPEWMDPGSAGAVGGVVGSLPDAPPPPGTPIEVGGRIQTPLKIYHVPPDYPAIAQSARIQGVVTVAATIDAGGSVSEARVLRSIPLLDQAALDAVRQWAFTPTLIDGQAVPVIFKVHLAFKLQ